MFSEPLPTVIISTENGKLIEFRSNQFKKFSIENAETLVFQYMNLSKRYTVTWSCGDKSTKYSFEINDVGLIISTN